MLARGMLVVLVVLFAAVVFAAAEPSAEDPKLPASLERTSGSRHVSYAFFAVLAGPGLLLLLRGIRAG